MNSTSSSVEPINISENTPSQMETVSGQKFITRQEAMILCLFTALITLLLALYGPSIAAKRGFKLPGSTSSQKVVYLDFEKVVSAGVLKAVKSTVNVKDIQVQADQFQIDIGVVVKDYTNAGYLVINSKALIGATPDQDITSKVITALGIN